MRDKVIGNQGSTTVEAALLYPIILLVIISLLIAGTVWYQKTYFKSVVYDCVQSVALSVTKSPDITVFTTDDLQLLKQPIYFFPERLNEMIRSKISGNIHKKLNRFVIYPFNEQSTQIRTKVINRLFYKQLVVEVETGCKVPMGFLFGETDEIGLLLFREQTSVIIPDTSELSWHMDMVDDSLKRFGLKDKTDQLLQELLRPIKIILEKMH